MSIQIDLWLWPLRQPDDRLAALSALLSDDEAGRARAFVRPEHARTFAAGRGRLREILSGYTGADPAKFGFAYTPQRKPWLPGGPVFNLSHSGGWAALAVTSSDLALGVDIEAHRKIEHDVAGRFFAPDEISALDRLPAADWARGFFRCWSRKEAFVKACGDGLTMALDSFDVSVAEEARLLRLDQPGQDPADWELRNLPLGPGLSGALAVRNCGAPVDLRLREGQMPLPPA